MAPMRILLPAMLLVTSTALAYEEPVYELLHRAEDYEVRDYAPYLVAETTVPGGFDETGNTAFRRLAGYIFGDNRSSDPDAPGGDDASRMNMTVPVTRHRGGADGGATVYRFVMERAYDMNSLPIPNDDRVTLLQLPGGPVAVLRYRGRITASLFARHAEHLFEALRRDGLEPASEPLSAVYNGPFTPPFLRRNEVLVPLLSYPPVRSQTDVAPVSGHTAEERGAGTEPVVEGQ